ncbi:MAG: hypothetical protein U0794_23710 [Isosphaeraceae bacterium]
MKLCPRLVAAYDFHRKTGNSPEDALTIAFEEHGVDRRLYRKLATMAFLAQRVIDDRRAQVAALLDDDEPRNRPAGPREADRRS